MVARAVLFLLLLVSPLFADERGARLGFHGENVILNESSLPQKTPRWLVTNRGSGQVLIGDSTMGLYQSLRINSSDIGKQFGKWTQVGASFKVRELPRRKTRTWAVCQCDCGRVEVLQLDNLRGGGSAKCKACSNAGHVTHGMYRSGEYRVYIGMIARCHNPDRPGYEGYGGRGIRVCERWLESFQNFYADMGPRPMAKYEIDRIDNDGNYEPGNCRWTTRKINARNTRSTRRVEYLGQKMAISAVAELAGVSEPLVRSRIERGWSAEQAATLPPLPPGAKA